MIKVSRANEPWDFEISYSDTSIKNTRIWAWLNSNYPLVWARNGLILIRCNNKETKEDFARKHLLSKNDNGFVEITVDRSEIGNKIWSKFEDDNIWTQDQDYVIMTDNSASFTYTASEGGLGVDGLFGINPDVASGSITVNFNDVNSDSYHYSSVGDIKDDVITTSGNVDIDVNSQDESRSVSLFGETPNFTEEDLYQIRAETSRMGNPKNISVVSDIEKRLVDAPMFEGSTDVLKEEIKKF